MIATTSLSTRAEVSVAGTELLAQAFRLARALVSIAGSSKRVLANCQFMLLADEDGNPRFVQTTGEGEAINRVMQGIPDSGKFNLVIVSAMAPTKGAVTDIVVAQYLVQPDGAQQIYRSVVEFDQGNLNLCAPRLLQAGDSIHLNYLVHRQSTVALPMSQRFH